MLRIEPFGRHLLVMYAIFIKKFFVNFEILLPETTRDISIVILELEA